MIKEEKQQPLRLPLDIATVEAAIESGIVLAETKMRGGATDDKLISFISCLRAVNRELADAKFDARFPRPPVRSGGEVVTPRPAYLEEEGVPS